jgi:hypothetical protein
MTQIRKTDTGYGLDNLFVHIAPNGPVKGNGYFLTSSWGTDQPEWRATKADAAGRARRLLEERAEALAATRARIIRAAQDTGEHASAALIDRLVVEFTT